MNIVKYPDEFLHKPTKEVWLPLNEDCKSLIEDMIEAMYANNGIGLAANQIGSSEKIFVMDVSNEKNNPQVFINPVIEKKVDVVVQCTMCNSKGEVHDKEFDEYFDSHVELKSLLKH